MAFPVPDLPIFLQLGFIIVVAGAMAGVARLFRQPLLLAYIVTGVIVGPSLLNLISSTENVAALSQIGIAFLLFLIGLNLNAKVLREVGKVSLITGIAQVAFTSFVGFFICKYLGLSTVASVYASAALTFSSTIVVVKILADKKDLDTLYGKISVGFLIIQDVIALFILIFLNGLQGETSYLITLPIAIFKALLLLGITILSGRILTPIIFPRAAQLSQELLFVGALSWMFLMAAVSYFLGLSIEIGAFMAGVGLASLPYVQDLNSKIKPLRDFFIILFFVHLGTTVSFESMQSVIFPAIILSLFVLIGDPLIVMILMRFLGYTKRTGLFTGLTVSQISEFSLILVVLGKSLGHIGDDVVSLVTLVGIITITISTLFMTHNELIYSKIKKYLKIFERRGISEAKSSVNNDRYVYVFFGANRIVSRLMRHIPKSKLNRILFVDHNPATVESWKKQGVDILYGDMEDSDVIERVIDLKPKIVLSTVPDMADNVRALREFKKNNIMFVSIAGDAKDALKLYVNGADYVIVPHLLGGEKAFEILSLFESGRKIDSVREEHIADLKRLTSEV